MSEYHDYYQGNSGLIRAFPTTCKSPLPPAPQQRVIESEPDRPRIHAPDQGGIFFQLRPVALVLLIQEGIHVRTFVPAGFVVHHPAHTLFIHKRAVDDDIDYPPLMESADGIFILLFDIAL